MTETAASKVRYIDRRVKIILRDIQPETLSRENARYVSKVKLVLDEIRLDVRDYEYSQTREEQVRWAKITRHNLRALNALLLRLDVVFSAADVAEVSAQIDSLHSLIK
jgi:exonuclease I